MRVKIIKAPFGCWYVGQLGSTMNVSERKGEKDNCYYVDAPETSIWYIYKEHCEILPDEQPAQPEPFDLERALKGDKVIMRDGTEIQEVIAFKTAPLSMPVMAAYKDGFSIYTLDGKYYNGGEHKSDLFMAPKEPQVVIRWVNVYQEQDGDMSVSSYPWETFSMGQSLNTRNPNYIGTFPVTITLKKK